MRSLSSFLQGIAGIFGMPAVFTGICPLQICLKQWLLSLHTFSAIQVRGSDDAAALPRLLTGG